MKQSEKYFEMTVGVCVYLVDASCAYMLLGFIQTEHSTDLLKGHRDRQVLKSMH